MPKSSDLQATSLVVNKLSTKFFLLSLSSALLIVWIVYGLLGFAPGIVNPTKTLWTTFLATGAMIPLVAFGLSAKKVDRRIHVAVGMLGSGLVIWYAFITGCIVVLPFAALQVAILYPLLRYEFNQNTNQGWMIAAFIVVLLGSWSIAATLSLSCEIPFNQLIAGGTKFTQAWWFILLLTLGMLASTWLFAYTDSSSRWTRMVDVLVVLLFGILASRRDLTLVKDNHHVSFFYGPAETVRHGGTLLWDTPSQYGIGNIWLIGHLPLHDTYAAFVVVSGSLTFACALLLYSIFRIFKRSPLGAVCAALIISVVVFFIAGIWTESLGFEHYPSIGGIRWIWCYVIARILVWLYLCANVSSERVALATGSIMWLCAVLWSVESAFWVTTMWFLGCGLFAAQRSGLLSVVRIWSLTTLTLIVTVLCISAVFLVCLHHLPDWRMYLEFSLIYGNGFGSYPLNPQGPVWVLVASFGILVGLTIFLWRINWRNRALPLLIGLCGMQWAISSYFVYRSHPNNICNLLPCEILIFACAILIVSRECIPLATIWRIAPIPISAVAIALAFGTASLTKQISAGAWLHKSPFDRSYATLPIPLAIQQLLQRNSINSQTPIVFVLPETNRQLPESPPFGPLVPPEMFNLLPIDREVKYLKRYAARHSGSGYILDDMRVNETPNLHTALRIAGQLKEIDRCYPYILSQYITSQPNPPR